MARKKSLPLGKYLPKTEHEQQLMIAAVCLSRGIPLEKYNGSSGNWTYSKHQFLDAFGTYRIAPPRKLFIPWNTLLPEWKWAAKTPEGHIILFTAEPERGMDVGWFSDMEDKTCILSEIMQDEGNKEVNWFDSLIRRPTDV